MTKKRVDRVFNALADQLAIENATVMEELKIYKELREALNLWIDDFERAIKDGRGGERCNCELHKMAREQRIKTIQRWRDSSGNWLD